MNASGFDDSLHRLADPAGRRAALRSLGAAGMALLAALGLAEGGEAKKGKRGGGKDDHRKQQRKGRAKRRERNGEAGQGAPNLTAEAGPPGDRPAPLQGPTGPTGPAGPAGADSQVTGPTGPAGSATTSSVASDIVPFPDLIRSFGYRDLGGPSATAEVPGSGRVLVTLTAGFQLTNSAEAYMSFKSTGGAGNVEADDKRALIVTNAAFGIVFYQVSATFLVEGLSTGAHTFTAQYQARLNNANVPVDVTNRRIIVIPLP